MRDIELFNLLQRIEAWVDMICETLSWAAWLDGLRTGVIAGMLIVLVLTHRRKE